MWKFHSEFTIKVYIFYLPQVLAWFYTNTVLPCMATNVDVFHLGAQICHTLAMKFINVSIAFIVIFFYIDSNISYKLKLLKILEIIWIITQICTEAFQYLVKKSWQVSGSRHIWFSGSQIQVLLMHVHVCNMRM